uniref:Putative secreted protein n=1 Tax=Anopheles triannulatus TaxID=58253 RepID=A0A2M4B363_9DIPT
MKVRVAGPHGRWPIRVPVRTVVLLVQFRAVVGEIGVRMLIDRIGEATDSTTRELVLVLSSLRCRRGPGRLLL